MRKPIEATEPGSNPEDPIEKSAEDLPYWTRLEAETEYRQDMERYEGMKKLMFPGGEADFEQALKDFQRTVEINKMQEKSGSKHRSEHHAPELAAEAIRKGLIEAKFGFDVRMRSAEEGEKKAQAEK